MKIQQRRWRLYHAMRVYFAFAMLPTFEQVDSTHKFAVKQPYISPLRTRILFHLQRDLLVRLSSRGRSKFRSSFPRHTLCWKIAPHQTKSIKKHYDLVKYKFAWMHCSFWISVFILQPQLPSSLSCLVYRRQGLERRISLTTGPTSSSPCTRTLHLGFRYIWSRHPASILL